MYVFKLKFKDIGFVNIADDTNTYIWWLDLDQTISQLQKSFCELFRWSLFNSLKANVRSSHRRCSMKKGILKNLSKFTEKHLCQSLFFNKVAGLGPAILLKRWLWHKCFPMNFVKFSRTPFFTEHLRMIASVSNLKAEMSLLWSTY